MRLDDYDKIPCSIEEFVGAGRCLVAYDNGQPYYFKLVPKKYEFTGKTVPLDYPPEGRNFSEKVSHLAKHAILDEQQRQLKIQIEKPDRFAAIDELVFRFEHYSDPEVTPAHFAGFLHKYARAIVDLIEKEKACTK